MHREYYPDNFDLTMKMQSKFFAYITPVLELVRQDEFLAAAEVMQHIVSIIILSQCLTTLVYNNNNNNEAFILRHKMQEQTQRRTSLKQP